MRSGLLLCSAGLCMVLVRVPAAGESSGTAWLSRYSARTIGVDVSGHRGFLLLPAQPRRDGAQPWVWYAPVITGRFPGRANTWLFTQLLARGIAVCGVDVGESYGSPDGRRVYTEFYDLVVKKHRFSPKACLLPQSRGGLMLYAWAAENPGAVQCIGGIFPVCNLESYPGLARASGAYHLTEEELRGQLPLHNPIDRLAALAARRVPILHVHGDADKVVPLESNSLELARRYKALGGKMDVVIVRGKGHEEAPEFFESRELLDFFTSLGKSLPAGGKF